MADRDTAPATPAAGFNRGLAWLTLCQGLFLTNNVTFIAINGLVGLSMAPLGWMATLPVMGYVVGGALSTSLVARTQIRFGRRGSFQIGLAVAFASSLVCTWAAFSHNFWLLCTATQPKMDWFQRSDRLSSTVPDVSITTIGARQSGAAVFSNRVTYKWRDNYPTLTELADHVASNRQSLTIMNTTGAAADSGCPAMLTLLGKTVAR